MVETATATALGQAAGTDTRHSAQNVRYKMKFNSSTGKWEQEQIMTPLVQTIYPGIRTKEGKTKDVTTGAIVGEPTTTTTTTTAPTTTPEPEVTPTPTTTPTTGLGGYQQVQQQYQQPTPSTTGGIRYEETQTRGVSESQQDRMKYNVMPGGLNLRSSAQNFSLSQSHGLIDDLVNPKVKTADEEKAQKKKMGMLPGGMGAVVGFLGSAIQPRSEKLQITKMIESGALQVREGEGYDSVLLSNEEAIKRLTQDENGRLKILKGQDLINSGLKITQAKHMSKDYAQSAAFMNFQEDKARNINTPTGVKLTTLNPVMGSSGTNLFGLIKGLVPPNVTNNEQVLVVGASGGGGYRSDGKFVGMNSQIYAFGTAAQATESANAGHIPLEVLSRMTNEDGTLKDLYTTAGGVNAKWEQDASGKWINAYAIDPKYISADGKYTGNVVAKNGDVITNGGTGTPISNISDPDSDRYKNFIDERWEEPVTPTREEVEAPIREKYDTTGRGGVVQYQKDEPVKAYEERKEKAIEKQERKTCFHPYQLIGKKFMKEFEPGDLINGKEILGMVKLKLNEDMYSINNVRVTGSHKVKFNNNWIFVSEHSDSIKINDKPEFVYVPIVEGGTFILNGNEFADYDDEHIETLNNKLNKRKVA